MRAMATTVAECNVPAAPLHALIQANRQDQQVTRYATYADLAQYCELSANPVGQIVLYIFGVATAERIASSDSICTALQLAEHWQDVAEDLGNGRIYLPTEDWIGTACTEADLAAPTAGPAVRELMIFEVSRARRCSTQGAPLVGTLRGAPGSPWRDTWPAGAPRWPPSGRSSTTCCGAPRGRASPAGRRTGPGIREREVSRR